MEKEFVEPLAQSAPLKKEVAHTPGPWFVRPEFLPGDIIPVTYLESAEVEAVVGGADGRVVGLEQARANACLIAAAPDLLAALQAIVNSDIAMREEDEGYVSTELEAARAAILKATSGSRTEGPAPTPLSE